MSAHPLPFVRLTARTSTFWAAPRTASYADAFAEGQRRADAFVAYLRDDPDALRFNVLSAVARDAAAPLPPDDPRRGYAAGFWYALASRLA